MVTALALTCAAAWGVSDFLGGLFARRHGPWVTAFAVQIGSLLAVAVAWAVAGTGLTAHDLGWAVMTGVGVGSGTGLLYRGFARGAMGVVGPVSAVAAAILPVTVGLATGERPGPWALAGIAVALPAIWLISAEHHVAPGGSFTGGVGDGLWSGLGFGMAFVGLGHFESGADMGPLTVAQAVALAPITLFAVTSGQRAIPTSGSDWNAAWIGPLGSAANIAFLWAVQHGELALTSVLASLYPAATVTLAAAVLKERIRPAQAVGLALAAVAVGLISLP